MAGLQACMVAQEAPTLLTSLSRRNLKEIGAFADKMPLKQVGLLGVLGEGATVSEIEPACRWCEYATSVQLARTKRGAKGRRARQEFIGDVVAGLDATEQEQTCARTRCANCVAVEEARKQEEEKGRRAEAESSESCFAWMAKAICDEGPPLVPEHSASAESCFAWLAKALCDEGPPLSAAPVLRHHRF